MPCWVNVQDGVLRDADVPDLRRFSGALPICGWSPPAATLALLDRAGVPARCWRFTQDPRAWPGGLPPLVARCRLALFGNEPDLEGWPPWYQAALGAWRAAGGQLVEPALSDESKYAATGAEREEEALALGTQRGYDAVSAHVYPLGLGAANLAAVRARAHGRPLIVSEFGIAAHQDQVLVQLAALGIAEPAAIYTYRAADAQAQPAYDCAGIAFLPPPPPTPSRAPKGPSVTTASDYCTQIDPQGSGENRCAEAVGASAQCSLIPGDYDTYQLMRRWTAAVNDLRAAKFGPGYVQADGTTSEDLIAIAPKFGLSARTWTTWQEALDAWAKGEIVAALVHNRRLEPRAYPAGAGWTEHADGSPILHWIRIDQLSYAGRVDRVFALSLDPLAYLLGAWAGAYQGPMVYTVQSVLAAIQETPLAEAGVVFAKAA